MMSDGLRVVIVGAGGFGAAVAWHLADGDAQVLVVDAQEPVSQTAPRAAGLTMLAQPDPLDHGLQRRSVELLERFDQEVGPGLEITHAGSLHLAVSEGVADHLRADVDGARRAGAAVDLLDPSEIEGRWPTLDPDGVVAASWTPGDVYFRPGSLPRSYLDAAIRQGVEVRGNSPVERIEPFPGGIRVVTPSGPIDADVIVDAAGAWMSSVAKTAGIRVPLVPVRHQLLVTEPVAGHRDAPIVRIMDTHTYTRPSDGGVLVGGYEPHPLAIDDLPGSVDELTLDLEVPRALMRSAARWVRPLRDARIGELRGGIPTMTADGRMLFGWIPAVPGLLVIGGCNVGGLSVSAAVGESAAALVRGEEPAFDLSPFDPMRFTGVSDEEVRLEALARYAARYHPVV